MWLLLEDPKEEKNFLLRVWLYCSIQWTFFMINKLKSRKDFIKIQRSGNKIVSPSFVIQNLKNVENENPSRFGFTASKKVGGAVQRNKAKRRMRSLVYELKNIFEEFGHDYVLIARKETVYKKYSKIKNDLLKAVKKLSN